MRGYALTFEERCIIEELHNQGFSCSHIARHLDRSKNCVITEIRKHKVDGTYSAKIAQQKVHENRIECRRKISEKSKLLKPRHYLKIKLENIEMQLEILSDAIKGLINK